MNGAVEALSVDSRAATSSPSTSSPTKSTGFVPKPAGTARVIVTAEPRLNRYTPFVQTPPVSSNRAATGKRSPVNCNGIVRPATRMTYGPGAKSVFSVVSDPTSMLPPVLPSDQPSLSGRMTPPLYQVGFAFTMFEPFGSVTVGAASPPRFSPSMNAPKPYGPA